MAKYQLVKDGIQRDDGACIPLDGNNRDYREYLEWVKAGNTPDPEKVYIASIEEQRRNEYNRLGSTPEAMIVALWERVVEGRLTATDALQVVREGVKTALPK